MHIQKQKVLGWQVPEEYQAIVKLCTNCKTNVFMVSGQSFQDYDGICPLFSSN